ncbi:hypothetical protein BH11PSE4_BH11PSE4_09410 [soil metagenome]
MELLCAVLILSAAVAAPASARHLRHHHHHSRHLPYVIDYARNYGPGLLPGTLAYYDGPLAVRCDQSAAAYRGQDGRRHPCF